MKLYQVLPTDSEEACNLASRYEHLDVVCEVDGTEVAFPQLNYVHRNVYKWWVLSDGSVVGWNESPRSGWTFIRKGPRAVENFYNRYRVIAMPVELKTLVKS